MVYLLALTASLANALTSVYQRLGIERAPVEDRLSLRLIRYAMHRRVWVFGLVLMVLSFVAQALALHAGRLSQVQPVLTTELLFLVLILAGWFHFEIKWKEWVAAVMAAAGLSGFLVFADPTGGGAHPSGLQWALVGGACGVAVAVCVGLAFRGPRWWRAAMFGTGAAIGFAFTAAMTKVVTDFLAADWVSIFRQWQTYGLAVVGVLSVFLTQNAIHAGPVAASQSSIVLVDPLASIGIGVVLFGDNLRTAGAYGPLEALSLLTLCVGAVWLARSPLMGGVDEAEEGLGELLSDRSRARGVEAVVADAPPPCPSV